MGLIISLAALKAYIAFIIHLVYFLGSVVSISSLMCKLAKLYVLSTLWCFLFLLFVCACCCFFSTPVNNKTWVRFFFFFKFNFTENATFSKHEKYCSFHSVCFLHLEKTQYCHLVGVKMLTCHAPPSRLLLSNCSLGVMTRFHLINSGSSLSPNSGDNLNVLLLTLRFHMLLNNQKCFAGKRGKCSSLYFLK